MLKKESITEKENKKIALELQQQRIKEEIGKINMEKMELNKQIEGLKDIEDEYKKIRGID